MVPVLALLLHAQPTVAADVRVDGTCPGPVRVRVRDVQAPEAWLFVGEEVGHTTAAVPGCPGGVPLSLAAPSDPAALPAPDGVVRVERVLAAEDCARLVQVVDPATCAATAPRRLAPVTPWSLRLFPAIGGATVGDFAAIAHDGSLLLSSHESVSLTTSVHRADRAAGRVDALPVHPTTTPTLHPRRSGDVVVAGMARGSREVARVQQLRPDGTLAWAVDLVGVPNATRSWGAATTPDGFVLGLSSGLVQVASDRTPIRVLEAGPAMQIRGVWADEQVIVTSGVDDGHPWVGRLAHDGTMIESLRIHGTSASWTESHARAPDGTDVFAVDEGDRCRLVARDPGGAWRVLGRYDLPTSPSVARCGPVVRQPGGWAVLLWAGLVPDGAMVLRVDDDGAVLWARRVDHAEGLLAHPEGGFLVPTVRGVMRLDPEGRSSCDGVRDLAVNHALQGDVLTPTSGASLTLGSLPTTVALGAPPGAAAAPTPEARCGL